MIKPALSRDAVRSVSEPLGQLSDTTFLRSITWIITRRTPASLASNCTLFVVRLTIGLKFLPNSKLTVDYSTQRHCSIYLKLAALRLAIQTSTFRINPTWVSGVPGFQSETGISSEVDCDAPWLGLSHIRLLSLSLLV